MGEVGEGAPRRNEDGVTRGSTVRKGWRIGDGGWRKNQKKRSCGPVLFRRLLSDGSVGRPEMRTESAGMLQALRRPEAFLRPQQDRALRDGWAQVSGRAGLQWRGRGNPHLHAVWGRQSMAKVLALEMASLKERILSYPSEQCLECS